jgi:hypothetical protein
VASRCGTVAGRRHKDLAGFRNGLAKRVAEALDNPVCRTAEGLALATEVRAHSSRTASAGSSSRATAEPNALPFDLAGRRLDAALLQRMGNACSSRPWVVRSSPPSWSRARLDA